MKEYYAVKCPYCKNAQLAHGLLDKIVKCLSCGRRYRIGGNIIKRFKGD